MQKDVVYEYLEKALSDESVDASDREYLQGLNDLVKSVTPREGDTGLLEDFTKYDQDFDRFRSLRMTKRGKMSQAEGLRSCVLRELHSALCQDDPRYQSEVKDLKSNSKLIIGAVAGFVAATIGVAVAVVSAIVAAAVWLILKIHINAFCEYFSRILKPE